jgi:hypothetical protein
MARPITMKDNYVQINPENKLADIHYLINEADINSKELKAEDIALLKEYIKSVSLIQIASLNLLMSVHMHLLMVP